MRKVILGLAVALCAVSFSFAEGNADTGKRIYLKTMSAQTGLNGADFAASRTIAEWKRLFEGDAEGFVKEIGEKYPSTKAYLNGEAFAKHAPHLGAFMINYAKDSGNFPSCN
jgi:hypothetical protein